MDERLHRGHIVPMQVVGAGQQAPLRRIHVVRGTWLQSAVVLLIIVVVILVVVAIRVEMVLLLQLD